MQFSIFIVHRSRVRAEPVGRLTLVCTPDASVFHSPLSIHQVASGRRAGAWTILLDTEDRYEDEGAGLPAEHQPNFYATSLADVQRILESELLLTGPGDRRA